MVSLYTKYKYGFGQSLTHWYWFLINIQSKNSDDSVKYYQLTAWNTLIKNTCNNPRVDFEICQTY